MWWEGQEIAKLQDKLAAMKAWLITDVLPGERVTAAALNPGALTCVALQALLFIVA